MFYILLFFLQLLLLFYLSRALTKSLSIIFFTLTHSKKWTIHLLSFLFLPGTIIHELAHALVAGIVGVHVGKISLFPELDGQLVKLGSVQIGNTDYFRRFLIGVAPFFVGNLLLLGLFFFASHNKLLSEPWMMVLLAYCIFEIGNTMFSSKKDMEGAIELIFIISLFCIAAYLLGLRLPSFNPVLLLDHPITQIIFMQANLYLLFPVILDCFIIGVLALFKH